MNLLVLQPSLKRSAAQREESSNGAKLTSCGVLAAFGHVVPLSMGLYRSKFNFLGLAFYKGAMQREMMET
jgi:hypothetical protein